jgi:hypothetical protein
MRGEAAPHFSGETRFLIPAAAATASTARLRWRVDSGSTKLRPGNNQARDRYTPSRCPCRARPAEHACGVDVTDLERDHSGNARILRRRGVGRAAVTSSIMRARSALTNRSGGGQAIGSSSLELKVDGPSMLGIGCPLSKKRKARDTLSLVRERVRSLPACRQEWAAQACWIRYFAKIVSTRLNALSIAGSGAMPPFMTSNMATLNTCSVHTSAIAGLNTW